MNSGIITLSNIRPEGLSKEEYLLFCISYKMVKLGKTPDMIFAILDKNHGGTIDRQEFLYGLKKSLDIWLDDEDIVELFDILQVNGEINKLEFNQKIANDRF